MIDIERSSGHEMIVTSSIQVQFLWMVDHWKQELISIGGCKPIPRIWSVEAFPSHDDPLHPPSPVYQKLVTKVDKDGIARAHLSGRSGPHHFSTTFTVQEHPHQVTIDVEIADHCEARVDELAATYLIEASNGKICRDDSMTIGWCNPNCQLVLEAEPPAKVEALESGMGTIRMKASTRCGPAEPEHRLRYRMRWVSVPGHQIWDRDV